MRKGEVRTSGSADHLKLVEAQTGGAGIAVVSIYNAHGPRMCFRNPFRSGTNAGMGGRLEVQNQPVHHGIGCHAGDVEPAVSRPG